MSCRNGGRQLMRLNKLLGSGGVSFGLQLTEPVPEQEPGLIRSWLNTPRS